MFQTIRSTGQSFAVADLQNSGILYRGDLNLGRITSLNSLTLVNSFDSTSSTEISVLQFRNGTFEKVIGVTQPGRPLTGYEVNFGDVRGIGQADCLFSIYDDGSSKVKLSILPSGGSSAAPADFITEYTGGLGATLAVSYAPLTDATVYSAAGSANPYVNALSGSASSHLSVGLSSANAGAPSSVMGGTRSQLIHFPKYVVRELTDCALSTQPDIVNKSGYVYQNGRLAFDGRGWLGFETIAQRSYVLGTTTTNTYKQNFPFLGQIYKTEITETSTKNNLKTTAYTLAEQATDHVYRVTMPTIIQTSYEGGRTAHSVEVDHEYDSYSNITKTTINSAGKTPLVVTKTYSNDTSTWIIGNDLSELITSAGTRMKETRHTYLPNTQVVNRVEEWISETLFSTKDMQYDGYGNKIVELGPWDAKRTFDYDSTHSFPTTVTDFVNDQDSLQTSAEYDYAVGQAKYIKEQNGYIKTQKFDVLGRLIEVSEGESLNALTVIDTREYKQVGNDRLCVRSTLSDKTTDSWSRETRYLDGVERTWKTTLPNISDQSVTVCNEILFDGIGRITRRYRSYLSSTPVDKRYYSQYTYDSFSRKTKVVTPAAADDTQPVTITFAYSYANNQTTIVETKTADDESSSTTIVLEYFSDPDASESEDFVVPLAVSSIDEIKQTIETEFDPLHRVVRVKDPKDVNLTMEWDGLSRMTGRKLSNPDTISPPAINYFTIAYDDPLRTTTITNHLMNSSTILVKDRIERTIKRTAMDGGAVDEVVDLVYDNSQARAQGQLSSVKSSKGVNEQFTYDVRGEEETSSLTLDGQTFTSSFEYTTSRHVRKITNPDGSVLTTQFFKDSDIVSKVELHSGDTSVSSAFSDFNNAFLTPLVSTLGNGLKSTVTLAENGVPVSSVVSNSSSAVVHQQTWGLNSLGRLSAYNPSSAAKTERLFHYDLTGE
jgi:YD repeat-containing protein